MNRDQSLLPSILSRIDHDLTVPEIQQLAFGRFRRGDLFLCHRVGEIREHAAFHRADVFISGRTVVDVTQTFVLDDQRGGRVSHFHVRIMIQAGLYLIDNTLHDLIPACDLGQFYRDVVDGTGHILSVDGHVMSEGRRRAAVVLPAKIHVDVFPFAGRAINPEPFTQQSIQIVGVD